MKIWIITARAFRGEEYFPRLEETKVAQNEEEAKKVFSKMCHSQGDWFWDGGTYDHYSPDPNTYVLQSDEAMCVVTKRELELDI